MIMRTWAVTPMAIVLLLGIASRTAAAPPAPSMVYVEDAPRKTIFAPPALTPEKSAPVASKRAKRKLVETPPDTVVPVAAQGSALKSVMLAPAVQLVQADEELPALPAPVAAPQVETPALVTPQVEPEIDTPTVDAPQLAPADALRPEQEMPPGELRPNALRPNGLRPAQPLRPAQQLRPVNELPPAAGNFPAAEEVSPQKDVGPISNVFLDTDLRQALQDIALQAQVTIVAGPEVTGLVTAELKDATLDDALHVVLAGTGYLVEQTPRYYLVYSPDPNNPALREISRTRRLKLEYLKADQAMKLLPPYYRDFTAAGEGTNVIAISAPPQIIEEIRTVIAEVDQPQRHVLLQSRVVVLNEIDLLNEGTQWGFPTLHMGGVVDDTLSGFGMRVGYTLDRNFTNELLVALNLLQRNDRAQILSEPVVMAQDGQSSKISVTRQEYFRIIAQGFYVQTNIEEIETGTILEITPQVGDNDEITLHLDIEVSDVTARGEDNLPVVDRRNAHNVVRLKDGGTAAIAGLMATEDQNAHQMVPWFGRIPLVGKVFHNQMVENSRKQVAVFITATIVEDPRGVQMPGPAGLAPGSPFHPIGAPVPVDEEEFREALKESLARMPRQDRGKVRK